VPPNSIDNGELPQPDPRIYGEFVLFLQQLSQSKSLVKSIGLTFMRRCIQEDVEPAMFMLKKANVMRTIEAMMENRLFIEATESTVFVGPNSSSDMIHESCCSACDHPMMTLPYRYRLEEVTYLHTIFIYLFRIIYFDRVHRGNQSTTDAARSSWP